MIVPVAAQAAVSLVVLVVVFVVLAVVLPSSGNDELSWTPSTYGKPRTQHTSNSPIASSATRGGPPVACRHGVPPHWADSEHSSPRPPGTASSLAVSTRARWNPPSARCSEGKPTCGHSSRRLARGTRVTRRPRRVQGSLRQISFLFSAER